MVDVEVDGVISAEFEAVCAAGEVGVCPEARAETISRDAFAGGMDAPIEGEGPLTTANFRVAERISLS